MVRAGRWRWGGLKRWLALAVVASMLAVPVASGVEWLRAGYDPGRTGATPFEGPKTNDTAFQVELPGTPAAEVTVLDGIAYVLTAQGTGWDGDSGHLNSTGLWGIDLSTGETGLVLDLPDTASPRLVSSELVVYEEGEDLVAVDIETGEQAWTFRVLADDPDPEAGGASSPFVTPQGRDYRSLTVVDDRLYTGFLVDRGGDGDGGGAEPGVAAIDLASGEPLWTWEQGSEQDRTTQRGITSDDGQDPDPTYPLVADGLSLAADNERVYVYVKLEEDRWGWVGDRDVGEDAGYSDERTQYTLWALDAGEASGEERVLWWRNDTEQRASKAGTSQTGPVEEEQGWVHNKFCCAAPTVTSTLVRMRLDSFGAWNKANGEPAPGWPSPAGRTDQLGQQGATGMGVRGDVVIGTSGQTVYRLDPDTGGLIWKQTDPTPTKANWIWPVVMDKETIYTSTIHWTGEVDCGEGGPRGIAGQGIDARDPATGELLWDWSYIPTVGRDECGSSVPNVPAFGPGVMVVGFKDGTVHVVGETEASIGPFLVEDERFPPAGENATVDLSGTGPGAFGPPTKYRVFWGDGTVSPWQSSPIFDHAYDESGDVTARLQAGNEANQTASTVVTMRVGATPPVEDARYPPVGEPIGLNPTSLGLHAPGADERYRVFWGDGTVSPWQASPIFNHTYDEAGNTTARVQSVDASNATSSTFLAMHVGMDPPPEPPEPTLLQQAFARENQDMTFGILGILVAVTGGAIGVGRRYRRRSRLEAELEALETGYEETKDRPGECEALLETRKGRARSLVLDGHLTEEQGSMVEARADELRRELRTHALSEEFGFLPYSLVTKAREMLEDGRVTSLEAEAFLAALQEVEGLTDDQRTRVRERIKSWFARDAGGGASP